MKSVLTVSLLVLALSLAGQTRRIAHRAHSGANHENYDGLDGNYGGGTSYIVQSQVVLSMDTMKTSDGRDSLYYRWDTLHDQSPAQLNQMRHQPVRRISQLGNICAPITVQ